MNKKSIIFLVALLLLPIFTGCATTNKSTYGRDFDETKKDLIVKGQTTKGDLMKILGVPNDKGLDEQNREWWVYLYQEGTYKWNSFDGFTGKINNEVRTKKLVVTFENDVVKNFVYSDTTNPYSSKW